METVLVDTDELAHMISCIPDDDRNAALWLGRARVSVSKPPPGRVLGIGRRYDIRCRDVLLWHGLAGGARQAAELVNLAAAAADWVQSGATVIGVRSLRERVGYEEAIEMMRRSDAAMTLMRERNLDY